MSHAFLKLQDDARKRTMKRKEDEAKGVVKKKRNSPDPAKLDFNKEGLKEKVEKSLEEEENPPVSISSLFLNRVLGRIFKNWYIYVMVNK